MRADVNALARAVSASPEAVAARIDVGGAAAGVARRVDALGSALVQLRLSLLASLERTGAKIDEPPWLNSLQATLAELASSVRPASAGVASNDLGERLAAVEFATGTVAADARLLVERVGPLPDRLAAMAAQLDRLTPLARSAGDAGSLLGQLARVSTGLEQVLPHVDSGAFDAQPAAYPEGLDDVVKFQAVLDMLAGVIRRQDQVATAVTSLLEQLNGPTGVVAAITRMAERERAVGLRLDRIEAGPEARSGSPDSRAVEVARPDDDRVQAAVLQALELQEEAFVGRLDRLDATIRALDDQAKAAPPAPGPSLELVLQRLDQQERTMAMRLEWVGDRLAEVAVHLVTAAEPAEEPAEEAAEPSGLYPDVEQRLEAVGDVVAGLSRHHEALTANLSRLVAQIPPPPDPSAAAAVGTRLDAMHDVVTGLSRHQEALTANLSRLVAQIPPPPDPSAAAVGARLDAVRDAVAGLGRRQEALTANVARLVAQIPPLPDPSVSAVAARRLEKLRNERVRVQIRLQQERLLVAQSTSTDPLDDDFDDYLVDNLGDEDFSDDAASS